jgi:hypothetical protein
MRKETAKNRNTKDQRLIEIGDGALRIIFAAMPSAIDRACHGRPRGFESDGKYGLVEALG